MTDHTEIIPIEDSKHLPIGPWTRILTLLDAGTRWYERLTHHYDAMHDRDTYVFSNGPQDTLRVDIGYWDIIHMPADVKQAIARISGRLGARTSKLRVIR